MRFKKSMVVAAASIMLVSPFSASAGAGGEKVVEQLGEKTRIQLQNGDSQAGSMNTFSVQSVQTKEQQAASFVQQYAGISNANSNLELVSEQTDDLGMTHLRFQQVKDGVPVMGHELIVHFDKKGNIQSVNGHYLAEVEQLSADPSPAVTASEALEAAIDAVTAPDELVDSSAELIYYPIGGSVPLTYKANVNFLSEKPGDWYVFIDAETGEVLDKYNTIHNMADAAGLQSEGTETVSEESSVNTASDSSVSIMVSPEDINPLDYRGSGGAGLGVLGDHRNLKISHTAGDRGRDFHLIDFSRPDLDGIFTFDAQYQTSLPGVPYANNNASFKDERSGAGVDAHYNSTIVYEYFLEEHGRNSIDDNGMPLVSTVHYGNEFNNAFWNGRQMTYGDGDGEFFIPLSAGLDVAAHEIAHGVTAHTAGLVYRYQPGAVNEAISDIFGVLVDDSSWDVGDNIMAPAQVEAGRTALRSLEEPGKFQVNEDYWEYGDGSGRYPSHMDEYYDLPRNLDNGGVHTNSSIINHAAYLIGIETGREVLGQIVYRALTVYLTSNSDFQDTRFAFVQSAKDLYGEDSEVVELTEAGFDGVGIYEE
ncbi:M4 family metallopeptidase [Evansella clarkii]|uniref:M4 family metallopeptidase n=1 Tax=Evansella clarkii TaxID=79879 RepID=UPI0011177361|nr:M4 family metallopeptidase [Evansella clarkii]